MACAGTLVSTCYVQLLLAGGLVGLLVGTLLHPQFWEVVGEHKQRPISFLVITLWHVISQAALNKYVTDGKRIKHPFVWVFAYLALSAGYCVVRLWQQHSAVLSSQLHIFLLIQAPGCHMMATVLLRSNGMY